MLDLSSMTISEPPRCANYRFMALLRKSLTLILAAILATGCMDHGPETPEEVDTGAGRGLFVVNEGNFMYGNASLSYYDIASGETTNEVFLKSNGIKLGDVAQSMVIHGGLGYIAVNNSGVVFVIDIRTCREVGKITGLTSPRHIHFVSDRKAYITDLYAFAITVFDPQTLSIIKTIPVDIPGKTQPSTEQMVQYGKYVFTNCWSYDNKILVIDTDTDSVIDYIEVGRQPSSMVMDSNGKLWVVTDGGRPGHPFGSEPAALYRIDAATRAVEKTISLKNGGLGTEICTDGSGNTLYLLDRHVWRMPATAEELPESPFIENTTGNFWYGLAADPVTSELYLADAVDKMQPGRIYKYSPEGLPADNFKVGIIPGSFCFKSLTP